MRCEHVQQTLVTARDEGLALDEATEAHVASCAACAAHAARDQWLRERLDEDAPPPLSSDFDARFMARLRQRQEANATRARVVPQAVLPTTDSSPGPGPVWTPRGRTRSRRSRRASTWLGLATMAAAVGLFVYIERADSGGAVPEAPDAHAEASNGLAELTAAGTSTELPVLPPLSELADVELAMELDLIEAMDAMDAMEAEDGQGFLGGLEVYASLGGDPETLSALSELAAEWDGLSDLPAAVGEATP